jgi:hypothetical protein
MTAMAKCVVDESDVIAPARVARCGAQLQLSRSLRTRLSARCRAPMR